MKTTLTWLTTLLLMQLGASQAALHAADAGSLSSSPAQQTVPVGQRNVSVTVDLGQSVHVMRGGIGASWHAIGPTVFHYSDLIGRDNRSVRGSGFGGNPPLQVSS